MDLITMDQVFYDATFDDGSSKQYIAYASEGVVFYGSKGIIAQIVSCPRKACSLKYNGMASKCLCTAMFAGRILAGENGFYPRSRP
jgi:hypothetical protein